MQLILKGYVKNAVDVTSEHATVSCERYVAVEIGNHGSYLIFTRLVCKQGSGYLYAGVLVPALLMSQITGVLTERVVRKMILLSSEEIKMSFNGIEINSFLDMDGLIKNSPVEVFHIQVVGDCLNLYAEGIEKPVITISRNRNKGG